MVKKNTWILYCLAFVFVCGCVTVWFLNNSPAKAADPVQEPIMVVLDGVQLQFDVPPTMINDRVMVPMRVIFEALGADIQWDEKSQTVTATKDDLIVKTTIGQKKILINNIETEIDVAPVIVDGRTLVPVRFVSEALGCEVFWDRYERIVFIYSPMNEPDNEPEEGIEYWY